MLQLPPRLTLIPTRRSSDLDWDGQLTAESRAATIATTMRNQFTERFFTLWLGDERKIYDWYRRSGDRKSTRLNSSHSSISYAVFCLKKKNLVCYLPLSFLSL